MMETPEQHHSGAASDLVGKVETHGVDQIPESDRHSEPKNMAWVWVGSQLCFAMALFGSFPLFFGLSFWASIVAIVIGTAIGSVIIGLMSISGPKTGTNQAVTSGAFFGVNGRLIGAAISYLINVGFLAIIAWTTGQAFVDGFHRYFDTPTGDGPLTIGIIITTIAMVALGWLGHATLIASYKFVAWLNGILVLAMFIVFSPHFSAVPHGEYLLGGFWPAFLLSITVIASGPISYSTTCNDYARYMPKATSPRALALYSGTGMFVGCLLIFCLGAFLTTTFIDPNALFVDGIIARSPMWFIVFLLLFSFSGNVVNGAMGAYAMSLDLHSLLYMVPRSLLALLVGAVTLVVTYVSVIALDALDTINAFLVIMTAVITAWAVINIIGFAQRRLRFYADDLHAFAVPGGRGHYWFTGGFNFRAVTAMAIGTAVGLLSCETTLFTGPIAEWVGADISFVAAGVVSGILYFILLKVSPETDVIPDEDSAVAVDPLIGSAEVAPS